ncbi:MAG TPA: SDR family oxidoreductase [Streptosporangiaceae bacterium]|nr:SDR family oxidoreductase [Streptosporangiaceae bacterium]
MAEYQYLERLFGLDGRVALVTGGSSGIGRAMGRALACAGAGVVLLARDVAALDQAVGELKSMGCRADRVSADLAETDKIGRIAETVSGIFGEPGILVNAAGVNPRPPLPRLSMADWESCLGVNLTAPFLLGQEFGPGMAARGWGRIINVASQQAFRAFGNSGAYGASKGGLMSLTRSQAEEWSRHGVCCNAIVPGFVPTRMTREAASDPARSAGLAARTMIGRNGEAADFEGATVFLASDASSYITGQAIFVDGGFSAT